MYPRTDCQQKVPVTPVLFLRGGMQEWNLPQYMRQAQKRLANFFYIMHGYHLLRVRALIHRNN